MDWPVITAKTSMEEIKEIHQRIWDYVIENGHKPDTPYPSSCVLCAFDEKYSPKEFPTRYCYFCPMSGIDPTNGCLNRLFDRYFFSEGETRTAYAKQIRDIQICTDEEMQERIKKLT